MRSERSLISWGSAYFATGAFLKPKISEGLLSRDRRNEQETNVPGVASIPPGSYSAKQIMSECK